MILLFDDLEHWTRLTQASKYLNLESLSVIEDKEDDIAHINAAGVTAWYSTGATMPKKDKLILLSKILRMMELDEDDLEYVNMEAMRRIEINKRMSKHAQNE